jgi:hypothetical protein
MQMKKINPHDMVSILSNIKSDLGCYFAGKEAEEKIKQSRNKSSGAYFDAIFDAVIKHYKDQLEEI